MAQPDQAPDTSMEEILASIRKIIAEDGVDPDPVRPPRLAVVPGPDEDEPAEPAETAVLQQERTAPDLAAAADADEDLDRADEPTGLAETAADPVPEAEAELGESDSLREELDSDPMIPEPTDEAAADESAEPAVNVVAEDGSQEVVSSDGPAIGLSNLAAEESEGTVGAPSEDDRPPRPTPAIEAIAAAMGAGTAEPDEKTSEDRLLSPRTDEAVKAAFDRLAHTIFTDQVQTLEEMVKDMMRPMLQHWLDDNLPVLVERLVREEIERVSRGSADRRLLTTGHLSD